MAAQRLPAFMIIGAVKAATTWLAHQLRHQRDIWLPAAEPHFFSSEFDRGLDWYGGLFSEAPTGALLGEKSADYLAHPDAAGRIARTLPGVPLIVQLRDPVERAYSDYCMLFRRGVVMEDIDRHFEPASETAARFLAGGQYAAHLRRLLDHIPRPQLKVVLYEDIGNDPQRVVQDVLDHIGASDRARPVLPSRQNDSVSPTLPLPLRRLLRPVRPWLDPLRSNPILARVRAAMARSPNYPPLGAGLKERLADYYRDDVRQLELLLGRSLSSWLGGSDGKVRRAAMQSAGVADGASHRL